MLGAGDMPGYHQHPRQHHDQCDCQGQARARFPPAAPGWAKVSVHDVHDGTVRWVGFSVEGGHHYPAGLTPGAVYFVAAQDMSRHF